MRFANVRADWTFRLALLRWGILAFGIFASLMSFAIVDAQEADVKVEIFNSTQSSYHAVLHVLPSVPVVGSVNFTVAPTLAATGEPLGDAEIILIAYDAEDVATFQVRALNTPLNRDEYIGNITIESPGIWQIHIVMTTDEFGEEVFVAQLSVAPAAVGIAPVGGIVMLGVLVLLLLGGGWVWLSSRRALARRNRLQAMA